MSGKPKKKRLVLNSKRAKLIKEVQKQIKAGRTPNISQAGKAAGFGTPQAAHRSLNTAKMQLPDLLDKVGLDAETVFKGFHESLSATKIERHAFQGIVMETHEDIAHDIRLRARIALANFHYPTMRDERIEPPPTTPLININLGFADLRRAQEVLGTARERAVLGDSGQLRVDVKMDEKP